MAPGLRAPAKARGAVRRALEGRIDDDVLVDALIVSSEIVSHRVSHGRLGAGESIGFIVRLGRYIVIGADDSGAPVRPEALVGDYDDESRFLRVLERLARRWGAGGGGNRPTLWAELEPGPMPH